MKYVDESRLEDDTGFRFGYLAEFIGFGPEDAKAVKSAAGLLAPLVPSLVDAVYNQLHKYSATWRHFLPRQHGYEGEVPKRLEDLDMNHPQIAFRKQHLARYLESLVTRDFDAKMVSYLDMVGKIHTPSAGSKEISVPLVQMNALMGFVADAVTATILGLKLDRETESKTLRAFGKLLWIQNDLIGRHYQYRAPAGAAMRG